MIVKKHLFRISFLFFIIAFSISCTSEEINDNNDTNIDLSLVTENDWLMSEDILFLINKHRTENSLNSLVKDSAYATAYAVKHSKYMIETQSVNHNNFFIRSNGLKERGAVNVSENVAYGYSSPESVVNAWLNSEGHREVIEGDFTSIGFGVIKSELNNK